MVTLLEDYANIIKSIESIQYNQYKTAIIKNFNQIFNKNIEDLYQIVKRMYNFKKNSGNLQYDYGRGILIEKFFDKVCSQLVTVEDIKQKRLRTLDNELGKRDGVHAFKAIEYEYSEYLLNQRYNNGLKTSQNENSHYGKFIIRKWGINTEYRSNQIELNKTEEHGDINLSNLNNYHHSKNELNNEEKKKLESVCD